MSAADVPPPELPRPEEFTSDRPFVFRNGR